MARPKKQVQVSEKKVDATAEELKELRFLTEIRKKELEILYKELAVIKDAVNTSISQLSKISMCSDNVAEVAFIAGKAAVPLDMVDNKLENMLEELYQSGDDFEHYEDIISDLN